MSAILGMFLGTSTLLVGIAEGPNKSLKCYVDARWKGIYFLVDDEADIAEIRRAWGSSGHVTVPMPSQDELYSDAEDMS